MLSWVSFDAKCKAFSSFSFLEKKVSTRARKSMKQLLKQRFGISNICFKENLMKENILQFQLHSKKFKLNQQEVKMVVMFFDRFYQYLSRYLDAQFFSFKLLVMQYFYLSLYVCFRVLYFFFNTCPFFFCVNVQLLNRFLFKD